MKQQEQKKAIQGFTLVEIMIVVAIIGLLATIAVPSVLRARDRARVQAVINDLRVFEEGLHNYNLENSEYPKMSFVAPFCFWGIGTLPPPLAGPVDAEHWNGETPCGGGYYFSQNPWGYWDATGLAGERHYVAIYNGHPELLEQVAQELQNEGMSLQNSYGKVFYWQDSLYYFIDEVTWQ